MSATRNTGENTRGCCTWSHDLRLLCDGLRSLQNHRAWRRSRDGRQYPAHETLFRLGIAAQLIGMAGFIFVALALYEC